MPEDETVMAVACMSTYFGRLMERQITYNLHCCCLDLRMYERSSLIFIL